MNELLTIPKSAIDTLQSVEADAKVERPHAHFAHPTDVVVDPALAKAEKLRVLEALEQDAKQLATAAAEGMCGGEDTQLHDVLRAKETLELPPADIAMSVVIQNLKSRLPGAAGTSLHGPILGAIDALEALCAAMSASPDAQPSVPQMC